MNKLSFAWMQLPGKYKENFDVSSEGLWSGVTSQTPDVGSSLETSKFSLYLSGSCIPIMNESLFTESNRSLITNEVNSTFLINSDTI
jgi:hypothetical protein